MQITVKFLSKIKNVTSEISKNLYRNLKAKNIVKIGVLIPDLAKGLDRFIGRQPHVEFLENLLLQRVVFEQIRGFFE